MTKIHLLHFLKLYLLEICPVYRLLFLRVSFFARLWVAFSGIFLSAGPTGVFCPGTSVSTFPSSYTPLGLEASLCYFRQKKIIPFDEN